MTARQLRIEAEKRIRSLSAPRLRVAIDFLDYLEHRTDNLATRELLRISGFRRSFNRDRAISLPAARRTGERRATYYEATLAPNAQ